VSSTGAGNAGLWGSTENSNPDPTSYFLSLCKCRHAQVEEAKIFSPLLMDLDIFLFLLTFVLTTKK